MRDPVVAFVCTRNSCRSQIAEAFGRQLAEGVFTSVSAGTHPAPEIDPVAVRMMKELHGVDMTVLQHPKVIGELPAVDILVTMGCGVVCPFVPNRHEEDWGLEDPVGRGDAFMAATIATIRMKVLDLILRIRSGSIDR
jgi:arsenate reductase